MPLKVLSVWSRCLAVFCHFAAYWPAVFVLYQLHPLSTYFQAWTIFPGRSSPLTELEYHLHFVTVDVLRQLWSFVSFSTYFRLESYHEKLFDLLPLSFPTCTTSPYPLISTSTTLRASHNYKQGKFTLSKWWESFEKSTILHRYQNLWAWYQIWTPFFLSHHASTAVPSRPWGS